MVYPVRVRVPPLLFYSNLQGKCKVKGLQYLYRRPVTVTLLQPILRGERKIAIDSSPPLYSAADRSGLDDRRFFVGQRRVESIPEVVVLYRLWIFVVVVDGAVVEQSAVRPEEEHFGGTLRTVRAGYLLRLVEEVGEVKPLLLRAFLHLGEAVSGVFFWVVGADGYDLHAPVRVVGLDLDYAIFPRSGVRTVVAGKDDRYGLLISVVGEGVTLVVHSRQFETYRFVARCEVSQFFYAPFLIRFIVKVRRLPST